MLSQYCIASSQNADMQTPMRCKANNIHRGHLTGLMRVTKENRDSSSKSRAMHDACKRVVEHN
jgi:hypothetical protein